MRKVNSRILCLLIIAFMFQTAFADLRRDLIEVRGKVHSYDQQYVFLNNKGRRTVVPMKYVSRKQLKSSREIFVFIPAKEYFIMQKNLKKRHHEDIPRALRLKKMKKRT